LLGSTLVVATSNPSTLIRLHPEKVTQVIDYYRDLVRPIVAGRKCILAMGPVGTASAWVRLLRDLGSKPPLILIDGPGNSSFDPDEAILCSIVREPATDSSPALRRYISGLQSPPPEVLSLIEGYDHDTNAVVLVTSQMDVDAVAGRPRYDLRHQEWIKLEDKTVIDSFWDVAGITRVQSRVIPPEIDIAKKVTCEIDQGLGTAWAGDIREGIHFGATSFRWVRTEEQLQEASAFFSGHCDLVRIMPFLEGLPCSIHGLVCPDDVIVFRPVENVVLRIADSPRLLYVGTATFWDPLPEDRRALRRVAQAVGSTLQRRVGYRGFFNVDGILTVNGFIPTELNTRMGAGGALIGACLPELPLALIDMAIRRGEPWDFRPSTLEELVLNAADGYRTGGGSCQSEVVSSAISRIALIDDGADCRPALKSEIPTGWIYFGPSGKGSFVSFLPVREKTPIGPPLTPRVLRAFAVADEMFEAKIGNLEAPQLVR
jgi:hypothetical protein